MGVFPPELLDDYDIDPADDPRRNTVIRKQKEIKKGGDKKIVVNKKAA